MRGDPTQYARYSDHRGRPLSDLVAQIGAAAAQCRPPDAGAAPEVLLTGSVRGVAPVVALDGRPLEPGPVTVRRRDAFERRVVEDR